MARPTPLPKVVIAETLDPVCADWLGRHAEVVHADNPEAGELQHPLTEADGLIVRTYTRVDAALLEQASQLKVVGRAGVGLDNIDIEACKQRGVAVVYTPDANTHAVVEYVLGLMLDELRPRHTLTGHIQPDTFRELRRTCVGTQLESLTLGILGFGRIGRRLGAAAHALGMNLLVNDVLPAAELRKAVDYPYDFVEKDQLYRGSDILSIHVDGRSENRHLINPHALSQLKPGCLLINTSRGMVIDSDALAAWAQGVKDTGGRAVLDVHAPEPPEESYPLYDLGNVRLLPHLASRTGQAMRNMSWVVRDVVAVLNGQPPSHPAW